MTVAEAIKELKKYPKDAEIYLCKDYEQCDEDGYLTDLYRLNGICHQVVTIDEGMDWRNVTEVLVEFENERAHGEINKNY